MRTSAPSPVVGAPSTSAQRPASAAGDAFEAMLLRQMLSAMRSASLASSDLASADAGPMRDMLDGRLAESMASRLDFGFGAMFARLAEGGRSR